MAALRYDFEQSIGYWVVPVARDLERAMNEELAEHGITCRQWQVLVVLVREPDISQAELARRLHVEAPTLAGIVGRMERDGWLERRVSPEDRRRNQLRLLPSVRPVWRRMVECARRVRARALRDVSADEFGALVRVMTKVQKNLAAATKEQVR